MEFRRYHKAAALIIRWTKSLDPHYEGHTDEINDLVGVFNRLNFEVPQPVELNTKTLPQIQLQRAFEDHIINHDGPQNLLIVFYTGHGGGSRDGKLEISAKEFLATATGHKPKAEWNEANRLLMRNPEADVLTLLDCCFALNGVKKDEDSLRVCELIAACSFDEITYGPTPTSFTRIMTKAMTQLLDNGDDGIPVQHLVQHMNLIRAELPRRTPMAHCWNMTNTYHRTIILAIIEAPKLTQIVGASATVTDRTGSHSTKVIQKRRRSEQDEDEEGGSYKRKLEKSQAKSGAGTGETRIAPQHNEVLKAGQTGDHEIGSVDAEGNSKVDAENCQTEDPVLAKEGDAADELTSVADAPNPEYISSHGDGERIVSVEDSADLREKERKSLFQQRVDSALGTANGYLKVTVLLIHWADDDECQADVSRLEMTFLHLFNYVCVTWRIPMDGAKRHLNHAVSTFLLDNDRPNNLLIVYYSGNGYSVGANATTGKLHLAPYTADRGLAKVGSTGIPWDEVERNLFDCESDVLTILDCCFASDAVKWSSSASNLASTTWNWTPGGTGGRSVPRAYQLLAASGIGALAFRGRRSFSRRLVKALEALLEESAGTGFYVTRLLEYINRDPDSRSAALLWDRLHTFNRYIYLAPLPHQTPDSPSHARTGEPESGVLTLSFSLSTAELSINQIEALAQQLPKACSAAGVLVRRINWVKWEAQPATPTTIITRFRTVAIVIMAAKRFQCGLKRDKIGGKSR